MAARLYAVIGSYIHIDQSGFLQNRFLKHNVWKLCNIFDFLVSTNLPALFYFVDAEKGFEWVEWQFMKAMLQKFWVGGQFLSWIDLIYQEQSAIISLQVHISRDVRLTSGVRQGWPLSPLLFNIVIESLASATRAPPPL